MGYINCMSAKETYKQIYHLRRAMSKASREGDRRAVSAYGHMISYYVQNQPKLATVALAAHVNKPTAPARIERTYQQISLFNVCGSFE